MIWKGLQCTNQKTEFRRSPLLAVIFAIAAVGMYGRYYSHNVKQNYAPANIELYHGYYLMAGSIASSFVVITFMSTRRLNVTNCASQNPGSDLGLLHAPQWSVLRQHGLAHADWMCE